MLFSRAITIYVLLSLKSWIHLSLNIFFFFVNSKMWIVVLWFHMMKFCHWLLFSIRTNDNLNLVLQSREKSRLYIGIIRVTSPYFFFIYIAIHEHARWSTMGGGGERGKQGFRCSNLGVGWKNPPALSLS